MLYEILKHIRNFFPDLDHQIAGTFTVKDGTVDPFPVVSDNQYVLIEGSSLNDGVIQLSCAGLEDEIFTGTITPLKIPREFIDLVSEIESYEENNKPSPFVSESFGGYSYSRALNAKGKIASWHDAFGTRLNAWRKI